MHATVSGALGGEQGGDQGLCDELAVALGWPSATNDEQFVEFGRTVGPRDVGGLFHRDARPQVAGSGQAAGVDGHPFQAGGVDLVHKGGDVGVSGAGAAFVLVSVVGASPGHPIGLFRAKHAAESTLRASGISWTVVRATAFMETWGTIMGRPVQASGKTIVFGHGDNPINFVSATDVAALVGLAATDPGLRGQVFEIGGPDDLTFNQVAAIVQDAAGRHGTVRHIPRPALRAMACLTAAIKPALARQARAALAMDTLDMTFDSTAARRAFPGLPNTDMPSALKELLA